MQRERVLKAKMSEARISQSIGQPAGLTVTESMVASLLSGLGLFILVLTLQPFAGAPEVPEAGGSTGNIVNQIGYISLALIYLIAMLRFTDKAVLLRLLSASWITILVVALISTQQAIDPAASFRGLLLASFAMVIVAGVLVLPRTERDFANAAGNACLAILLLVYAMLLLAPDLVVHGAEGVEGGHAGHWKGHLSHKNYAAPVFSVITMIGVYCWRSGFRLRGIVIAALGVIFVWNSGSRTTMGFLPLAIGIVLMKNVVRSPRLVILAHLAVMAVIAAFTVGTVFSTTLLETAKSLISDVTYTGRDEIWKFASAHIGERPWLGYGYLSFWQTPIVTTLEENFEASWDVRGIGSAHNSYLDAFLMFGIPGGLLVIFSLVVLPLKHYLAACRSSENTLLTDLFAMIVFFMSYVAMLESIFLNRADPFWLLFAMAVLGLGLASRMRVRHGPPPDSAGLG